MRMRNRAAALSAAVMMAANMAVIPAAAEENGYIYISTVAELKDLSNNCMIDSFSDGKTVLLKNDIDLKGEELNCIGYFNGVFDGCGYTIKGLKMEFSDPERGFIGTVGTSGVVRNLKLDANIKETTLPEEDSKLKIIDNIAEELTDGEITDLDRYTSTDGLYTIGGICGINKGKIENCEFTGTIRATKAAGAMAGINDNTGVIVSSRNRGTVFAKRYSGGIVGKNHGVVRWCENFGKVNNEPDEEARDIGGICGSGDGAVMECYNRGTVGYKNTGKNVGGIIGEQSGYTAECINYSTVYGKHEVGGIVGHFEPYININFNEDDIQRRINETADKIKDNVTDIQDNVDDNVQTIHDSILDLKDNLFPSLKSGSTSLGALGALASLAGVSDNVTGIADELKTAIRSLTDVNNTLSEKIGNSTLSESVSDISDSIDRNAANAVNSIDRNSSSAVDSLNSNLTGVSDSVKASSQNLDSMVDSAEDAIDNLSAHTDELSDNLNDSNDRILDVLDTLDDVLNNTDANTEELVNTLTDAISDLDINVDVSMDGLDFTATDRQLAKSINEAFDGLDDDVKTILEPYVRISEALLSIMDSVENRKQLLQELINQLKEELQELLDSLTSGTIPTMLPVITQEPDKSASILSSLFETTAYAEEDEEKTTLQKLADLDIKDLDIEIDRTLGDTKYDAALVRYCINSGEVNGMSDTGGIAGSVGFESKILSSKDNINKEGYISLDPSTAVKAVINASINEGTVNARTTSAGGITGFSDLGSIKDCINTGHITVSEGPYAGGISGYNMHNITRCINTGDTDATSDVGGIAGRGTNIEGSYALARTESTGPRMGAIAGTSSGTVKNNYFLKEELGGINGVDYVQKAQSVSADVLARDGEISKELVGYDDGNWTAQSGGKYMPQLAALTQNKAEGISDTLKAMSADCAEFKFDVEFIKDGETVASMRLDYGETIDPNEIPELEKRRGEYGVWDKDTSEKIIRDTVFTAVYNRSKSTLSYGPEPPTLLAEGNFTPNAILEVEEFDAKSITESSVYVPESGYRLRITEDGREYEDELLVRVRDADGDDAVIGIVENGALVITECERDGSYVKFNMEKPGGFVLMHKRSRLPLVIGISAGAILLLLALMLAMRKRAAQRIHFIKEKLGAQPKKLESGEGSAAEALPEYTSDKEETDNGELCGDKETE